MKVRVIISRSFTDEERREINAYYGERGLASRDMLKDVLEAMGDGESLVDVLTDGATIIRMAAETAAQ